MSVGGFDLRRLQKPTQNCPRCGLYYPKGAGKCSHCGDLGDEELKQLLNDIDKYDQSNRNLGLLFLTVAVVILALLGLAIYAL